MSQKQHEMRMSLIGIMKDCHEKFPITFDYGKSGTAYLQGARVHSTITLPNGAQFERRMEIRAFGEVAEQLAHIQNGDYVELEGTYDEKPDKDGKRYFPVVTIDKVIVA